MLADAETPVPLRLVPTFHPIPFTLTAHPARIAPLKIPFNRNLSSFHECIHYLRKPIVIDPRIVEPVRDCAVTPERLAIPRQLVHKLVSEHQVHEIAGVASGAGADRARYVPPIRTRYGFARAAWPSDVRGQRVEYWGLELGDQGAEGLERAD